MDQMMTHANCQNPMSFRTHESMGLMWVYHAVCICGLEVRINHEYFWRYVLSQGAKKIKWQCRFVFGPVYYYYAAIGRKGNKISKEQ